MLCKVSPPEDHMRGHTFCSGPPSDLPRLSITLGLGLRVGPHGSSPAALSSDEPPSQLAEPEYGSHTGDRRGIFMGPRHPLLIPAHTGQPLPARVDLALKPEAAPHPTRPCSTTWVFGELGLVSLMKEGSPSCWEEADRGHLVLDHCLARLTVSLTSHPPTLRCT